MMTARMRDNDFFMIESPPINFVVRLCPGCFRGSCGASFILYMEIADFARCYGKKFKKI
jgi:hypothetical protein